MRQIRPIFHPRHLEIASNIDINQVQKPFKINGKWEYRAINPWTFKRVIPENYKTENKQGENMGKQHTATDILEQGSFMLRKDIRSKAQKEAEVFLREQKRFNERQEQEAKKKMMAPRLLRGTVLERMPKAEQKPIPKLEHTFSKSISQKPTFVPMYSTPLNSKVGPNFFDPDVPDLIFGKQSPIFGIKTPLSGKRSGGTYPPLKSPSRRFSSDDTTFVSNSQFKTPHSENQSTPTPQSTSKKWLRGTEIMKNEVALERYPNLEMIFDKGTTKFRINDPEHGIVEPLNARAMTGAKSSYTQFYNRRKTDLFKFV